MSIRFWKTFVQIKYEIFLFGTKKVLFESFMNAVTDRHEIR